MKTLELLRRNRKVRVAEVDGPDGYYIELEAGWSFDPMLDNRVTIAPTVTEARRCVANAYRLIDPPA